MIGVITSQYKSPCEPWVGFHEIREWLIGTRVSGTMGVLMGGPKVYSRELFGVCVGLVGVMEDITTCITLGTDFGGGG